MAQIQNDIQSIIADPIARTKTISNMFLVSLMGPRQEIFISGKRQRTGLYGQSKPQ